MSAHTESEMQQPYGELTGLTTIEAGQFKDWPSEVTKGAAAESKYFGPFKVGTGNLVLEEVRVRVDPDDHITIVFNIHWGKLKTYQPRTGRQYGPHIRLIFKDTQQIPVTSEWDLGQFNRQCSPDLRWEVVRETTIEGAFENSVWVNVSYDGFEWWYC